jgi:hypothetical protein
MYSGSEFMNLFKCILSIKCTKSIMGEAGVCLSVLILEKEHISIKYGYRDVQLKLSRRVSLRFSPVQ